jgi:capsular polysaccharide biosynthesis protein
VSDDDDAWYNSEESTRLGMIVEVQRIRRRMRARPGPVFVISFLLAVLISFKIWTRPTLVESRVVLALSQGELSSHDTALPVDELRQYVVNVLLPDKKLGELIEKKNLSPSRHLTGMPFAIDSLRDQFDIDIWKNTFELGDDQDRSARIGITVTDTDPDRSYELARDLGTVVITSAQEQRLQMTKLLASRVSQVHDSAASRLEDLAREESEKEIAISEARRDGKLALAQALNLELAQLAHEQASAEKTISDIATSQDSLADRLTAAGLDLSVTVVDERRGQVPEHREFIMAMVAVLVALAALLGTALVMGAFDPRVHDTDDVERLGLSVLGHLPGFPGDEVGSLEARGVARARVPSFLRWRSHR